MNLFGFLKRRRSDPRGDLLTGDSQRMTSYARYLRAYEGYAVKGPLSTGTADSAKRLKFNFSAPICNLGAGWMAAAPISWSVDGDPDATEACNAIWARSGSEGQFLEAVLLGAIYGDVVALATQNDAGEPLIEFVDPCLCFPQFEGRDYRRLRSLEIAFEEVTDAGETVLTREFYDPTGVTRYEGDREGPRQAYEAMPAVWIRNMGLKGLPFGISDLHGVTDLVEEYDHICGKWTRILDYVAQPKPWFKGIQKGDASLSPNTVLYLPKDGDCGFLEYKGHTPDVDLQLTRVRNAIVEISQVPAVAFGQADSGLTSLSGVAIQILYGPLMNKSQRRWAGWGPGLERVMWRCLVAAGHPVKLEQVHACRADALPVDGQARVAEETGKVAAQLLSRRTAMNNLGVENPDSELKKIVVEEKILQLGAAPPDPVAIAKAAAKGSAVSGQPSPGTTTVKPQGPAAAAFGAADPAASIDELLATFDQLIAAENDNLDAQDEGDA